jgi:ubiquinone/menaquinone biosynthesis C-methylase UbiE
LDALGWPSWLVLLHWPVVAETRVIGRNDEVVQAFTELAPNYVPTVDRELRQFWGVSYQDLIARLLQSAPVSQSSTILDLATGTARIPLTAAPHMQNGGMVVGLDITPAMLRFAAADVRSSGLTSRITLICASAMEMPFGPNTFDLAICGLATHHMQVRQLLLETARVLKPGGRLVMTDVSAPRLWRSTPGSAAVRLAAGLYAATHRSARARAEIRAIPNIRTTAEWQDTLAETGFDDVEILASYRGRRPLYPSAFVVRATKGVAGPDTGNQSDVRT